MLGVYGLWRRRSALRMACLEPWTQPSFPGGVAECALGRVASLLATDGHVQEAFFRAFETLYAVPHRGRGLAARLRVTGALVDGGDKLRVYSSIWSRIARLCRS